MRFPKPDYKPGDLVRTKHPMYFYTNINDMDEYSPYCRIEQGIIGLILERSENFQYQNWVKWFVNGEIGYSTPKNMEILNETR